MPKEIIVTPEMRVRRRARAARAVLDFNTRCAVSGALAMYLLATWEAREKIRMAYA